MGNVEKDYILADFCSLIAITRKTVGDWCHVQGAPCKKEAGTNGKIWINVPEMWNWRIAKERELASKKPTSLGDAKVRKEAAQAEKAELEVAIMKEEYLPRAAVEKLAFERGQYVKEALSAFPDRLTGVLMGQDDEEAIRSVLQKEITRVLKGLSKQYVNISEDKHDD